MLFPNGQVRNEFVLDEHCLAKRRYDDVESLGKKTMKIYFFQLSAYIYIYE